jgi:DNA-binding transcriptional MerR regulator
MKAEGYSIKDLEVLSGVKAHTIRIWEKRYRLLTPTRTDTNIRYYNDDDLRRILNISLLVKNRYKISKVAKWSELQIRNTVLEVTGKSTSESDYVDRLILFMLNFDNQGFYRLTTEIIIEKGLEEALTKVIFSLFERIGTYWMVGSIFPAQEHNITNIIRQKLIVEIDKLGVEATRNSSVLFFLPDNELHEMGLLFYTYITRKIDYVFTAFVNSITKSDLEQYLIKLKETFVQQKIFITGWQVQHHMPQLPRSVKIIKDYRELQKYLG